MLVRRNNEKCNFQLNNDPVVPANRYGTVEKGNIAGDGGECIGTEED